MSQPLKEFNERIIGMMIDYKISMCEALVWDFEGCMNDIPRLYRKGGDEFVESKFRNYLSDNGMTCDEAQYYTDIFMGREEDMELKPIEKNDAKSQDE